ITLSRLFFLPILPHQSSPSTSLITHISRSFPAQPLPAFFLDHRLFIDTSSLLPNADISLRKFTSILTLSHTPTRTYVATSAPKDSKKDNHALITPTMITIPSSALETFTQLVGTKLQPQWAHRQSLTLENGTSLSLSNGEWTVRLGDLKIPSRPNQAGSTIRALVFEISYNADSDEDSSGSDTEVHKDDEGMIRSFLESLLDGTAVRIDNSTNSRDLFRKTGMRVQDSTKSPSVADFSLATLYMDMLRGSR
ncbi:uncharacterized protein A1O9_04940, partial [Exophiala aquamarina CBS 119918]